MKSQRNFQNGQWGEMCPPSRGEFIMKWMMLQPQDLISWLFPRLWDGPGYVLTELHVFVKIAKLRFPNHISLYAFPSVTFQLMSSGSGVTTGRLMVGSWVQGPLLQAFAVLGWLHNNLPICRGDCEPHPSIPNSTPPQPEPQNIPLKLCNIWYCWDPKIHFEERNQRVNEMHNLW